jgi:hypothetical protein
VKPGCPQTFLFAVNCEEVLLETRFVRGNPGYIRGKPCVYVGMTGLDPDIRFTSPYNTLCCSAGSCARRWATVAGSKSASTTPGPWASWPIT